MIFFRKPASTFRDHAQNCNSDITGYPIPRRRQACVNVVTIGVPIEGETDMAKSRTGLDHRHRDKSGRIERKHGNTRVAALRKEYGPGFAKGRRKDTMLKTLLAETGSASLHDYLKHHHK
jgi:hypothetical protein